MYPDGAFSPPDFEEPLPVGLERGGAPDSAEAWPPTVGGAGNVQRDYGPPYVGSVNDGTQPGVTSAEPVYGPVQEGLPSPWDSVDGSDTQGEPSPEDAPLQMGELYTGPIVAASFRPGGPNRGTYETADEAAVAALNWAVDHPKLFEVTKQEYAGQIYQNPDGSYSFSMPVARIGNRDPDDETSLAFHSYPYDSPIPDGTTGVATYHTHLSGNDVDDGTFSFDDRERIAGIGGGPSAPAYMIDTGGFIHRLPPSDDPGSLPRDDAYETLIPRWLSPRRR